jgi:hypothetical protein
MIGRIVCLDGLLLKSSGAKSIPKLLPAGQSAGKPHGNAVEKVISRRSAVALTEDFPASGTFRLSTGAAPNHTHAGRWAIFQAEVNPDHTSTRLTAV